MALSDDGRVSALAADRRSARDVRGHGDGHQGPGVIPLCDLRQDGRALVHQTLGGASHRRIAPNAHFESSALAGSSGACVGGHALRLADIQDDAVGSAEIAENAVDSSEVAANAVKGDEIDANAVDSSEIAANAVGSSEIAANAVRSDELSDGVANRVDSTPPLIPGGTASDGVYTVDTSVAGSNAGLLPQPGGFEGLLLRPVLAAPRDLPVADRVGDGEGQIGFDAAQLGASAEPQDRHDLFVCRVDQLQRLGPKVVERVEPVLEMGPYGVLAMHRATVVERTLDSPVIDVVRQVLEPGIQVATVERRSRISDDLHVLL
jgi:hypothetical protein